MALATTLWHAADFYRNPRESFLFASCVLKCAVKVASYYLLSRELIDTLARVVQVYDAARSFLEVSRAVKNSRLLILSVWRVISSREGEAGEGGSLLRDFIQPTLECVAASIDICGSLMMYGIVSGFSPYYLALVVVLSGAIELAISVCDIIGATHDLQGNLSLYVIGGEYEADLCRHAELHQKNLNDKWRKSVALALAQGIELLGVCVMRRPGVMPEVLSRMVLAWSDTVALCGYMLFLIISLKQHLSSSAEMREIETRISSARRGAP